MAAMFPPGFRFHPTDCELVGHYLARKVSGQDVEHNIIPEVDLYKFEPWDLPELSYFADSNRYFFSPLERKTSNGANKNRATCKGFWKASGKDQPVCTRAGKKIGMKKILVFYLERAPRGVRTEWVMHEYRLDSSQQGSFVVCRVFNRKHDSKDCGPAIPKETAKEDFALQEVPHESPNLKSGELPPVSSLPIFARGESESLPMTRPKFNVKGGNLGDPLSLSPVPVAPKLENEGSGGWNNQEYQPRVSQQWNPFTDDGGNPVLNGTGLYSLDTPSLINPIDPAVPVPPSTEHPLQSTADVDNFLLDDVANEEDFAWLNSFNSPDPQYLGDGSLPYGGVDVNSNLNPVICEDVQFLPHVTESQGSFVSSEKQGSFSNNVFACLGSFEFPESQPVPNTSSDWCNWPTLNPGQGLPSHQSPDPKPSFEENSADPVNLPRQVVAPTVNRTNVEILRRRLKVAAKPRGGDSLVTRNHSSRPKTGNTNLLEPSQLKLGQQSCDFGCKHEPASRFQGEIGQREFESLPVLEAEVSLQQGVAGPESFTLAALGNGDNNFKDAESDFLLEVPSCELGAESPVNRQGTKDEDFFSRILQDFEDCPDKAFNPEVDTWKDILVNQVDVPPVIENTISNELLSSTPGPDWRNLSDNVPQQNLLGEASLLEVGNGVFNNISSENLHDVTETCARVRPLLRLTPLQQPGLTPSYSQAGTSIPSPEIRSQRIRRSQNGAQSLPRSLSSLLQFLGPARPAHASELPMCKDESRCNQVNLLHRRGYASAPALLRANSKECLTKGRSSKKLEKESSPASSTTKIDSLSTEMGSVEGTGNWNPDLQKLRQQISYEDASFPIIPQDFKLSDEHRLTSDMRTCRCRRPVLPQGNTVKEVLKSVGLFMFVVLLSLTILALGKLTANVTARKWSFFIW